LKPKLFVIKIKKSRLSASMFFCLESAKQMNERDLDNSVIDIELDQKLYYLIIDPLTKKRTWKKKNHYFRNIQYHHNIEDYEPSIPSPFSKKVITEATILSTKRWSDHFKDTMKYRHSFHSFKKNVPKKKRGKAVLKRKKIIQKIEGWQPI